MARAAAFSALRKMVGRLPHLDGGASRPSLASPALAQLARDHGTPLHVVDADRLAQNVRGFAARGCELSFRYRDSTTPSVLRVLNGLSVGATVTSPYELGLAHAIGVPSTRIVYAGPRGDERALRALLEARPGLFEITARRQLAPLARAARALGRRVPVGIRVSLHRRGTASRGGERLDTGAALQAFAEALERPELEVVALHVQLGEALVGRRALRSRLETVLRFTAALRSRLGLDLEQLVLGGSPAQSAVRRGLAKVLGASLARPDRAAAVEVFVAQVSEQVRAAHRRAGRPVPQLVLEPGVALTADAELFLCHVVKAGRADASGLVTAIVDLGAGVGPLPHGGPHVVELEPRPGVARVPHRLIGPGGAELVPRCELQPLMPSDVLSVSGLGLRAGGLSGQAPGVVVLEGGRVVPVSSASRADADEGMAKAG